MENKIDFLYIFNYSTPFFKEALDRLLLSIESIKNQNINICICNNSPFCIYDEVSIITKDFKYIHKEYNGPFSKALGINYGVKNLVKTEYFILSDIDLIYSSDHIQRLMFKFHSMANDGEKIRFVCYNYNLMPNINKPEFARSLSKFPIVRRFFQDRKYQVPHDYSSNYIHLDQLPKYAGGYAHGNGLIHLDTFMRIRGYDEDMIGHGPEDSLFNNRISKVNRIIYDNLPDTATYHLWHPEYNRIQIKKNMQIWESRSNYYSTIKNPTFIDVSANLNQKDWGVII